MHGVFGNKVSRGHVQEGKMRYEKGKKKGGQTSCSTCHSTPSAMTGTGGCSSITIKTPPPPRAIEACLRLVGLMMSWEGSLSQCSSLNSELQFLNYWLEDIMKNTKEAHQEANSETLNVEYPFHKDDGYDFDGAVEVGCRFAPIIDASDYEEVGEEEEEEEEEEEVDPAQIYEEEFRWSSVNFREETKGRYLCVSNGFEIWCLDLKQSRRSQDPGPLPKVATLNLLGDRLPASVGLFKLGSDLYMIGGHDVPTSLKEPLDVPSMLAWGKFPSRLGINRYKILCNSWGIKGSSRIAYRLSLAEDGTLSPHETSKIKELNHPKVWPIVEKINGQLHVVDSVPCHLISCCCDWSFSHEVCNIDGGGGWEDVSTIEAKGGMHINSHVAVGDRIYAVAYEDGSKECYIEFDSCTKIWKRSPVKPEYLTAFNMKRVWNILAIGKGRCVGEFPCGGDGGERVFVLVAIVKDYDRPDFVVGTQAVAYLVTSTGLVLCYQPLPDFFEDKSLNPCFMIAGTMIHVDDDEEGPTRTMCSVVSGTVLKDVRRRDHLFVNTFSVEMRTCLVAQVRQLLVEKASETTEEVSPAIKLDFVRVVLKDSFVYQTDTDLKVGSGGDFGMFVGWRAGFLTL